MPDETLPAWDLVRTAHVVELELVAMFDELGLSPTQFGVLAALGRDRRPTQAELAREVLVTPQSMGALVASLLDRGLVERDGPGGRGRRAGIVLTDSGRAALARAWPRVREGTSGTSLGLDERETAALVDLLARIRGGR